MHMHMQMHMHTQHPPTSETCLWGIYVG
jgi:hypothetical protein